MNSGLVLEKVCEYFYYNEKHKNSKDVPDIDVPAELCLELLMAADYLNGMFPSFWGFACVVGEAMWCADLSIQFRRHGVYERSASVVAWMDGLMRHAILRWMFFLLWIVFPWAR